MNLLLINHYAGSPRLGMEFRPYYLAREWVRSGHRVLILGASYSHLRSVQPAAGREVIDGIEYRWLPAPRYDGNGVGRAWNIARFLGGVFRLSGRIAREFKPDVVIASSTYPMDIWGARRIARHTLPHRARLVYEVHDLWPLSLIELAGMSTHHPFVQLCQRAENDAYRRADRVISMLPNVHGHMASHGLDIGRLTIVPNGVAPDDWDVDPEPLRADVADAIARLRQAGRTVVGYAGSMGLPNALDTVLDAARLVQDAPLHVVMVGDGHEAQRLRSRIERETIGNVTWFAPIPKQQIPSFLRAIDFAYIGWQRSPIYRFGIAPNKLMDYMMAACPVLHSVDAGNDPVAESGCGVSVPPESPRDVAQALRQLAAMPAAQRQALGRRGHEYVLAHHAYPVLAQRFIDAVAA